jgi:hypothetical protein
MQGDRKEVVFQDDSATLERGRKMSLRIGVAFLVLMAVNVAAGLFFIAHHEATSPNRKLLADQARKQLEQSLRDASKNEMPAPTLDLGDVSILTRHGGVKTAVDSVTEVANKAGGQPSVGPEHESGTTVIIEIPATKEADLCLALNALPGVTTPAAVPAKNAPEQTGNRRVIVHVTEDKK